MARLTDLEFKKAKTRSFFAPIILAALSILACQVTNYILAFFIAGICGLALCGWAVVSIQEASSTKDYQDADIAMAGFKGSCIAIVASVLLGFIIGRG